MYDVPYLYTGKFKNQKKVPKNKIYTTRGRIKEMHGARMLVDVVRSEN